MKSRHNKWYFTTTAIIFTVVAIAHLAIIIWDLEPTVGGFVVPAWFSGAAVMMAGYLATRGFMEAHKH